MRYSTAILQIVKIVRLVVKFHALLTVTSLIFQVILLKVWIEEEVSNQWKALKVYCQSTIRALLDLITEKMKNLSNALQMHLNHEAEKDQPKTKLVGRIALFSATFLLLDTEVHSKYDKRGVKIQSLLLVGLKLLKLSKLRNQFKILQRCDCATNLSSNFTFFILALVFANSYGNSLRSLSFMLFIAVYLLCLLVVLRPPTDLGLFSFIIGVIGSITYNLFEFTSPTWIIALICFVLISFKSWLDKYWLDLEEDQSLTSTNTTARSTSVFFILISTAIDIEGDFFMCLSAKSPLSNYKDWSARVIASVIWYVQANKKNISPPTTNTKEISSLILTIVNVAQGMFIFMSFFIMSPMGNHKDWLFVLISYVAFCFWLRSFCPRVLSAPSTNIKGINGMILYLQSVATYGIMVLAGFEPHFYYRGWLIVVTCNVLWWVRLGLSTTIEFKVIQWWAMVVNSTVAEVVYWTIQLSTRH